MGSDEYVSKKLGGPPSGGTGQNRLGPGDYAAGDQRDPAVDALSGLGDSAANLVEISGVIKWFDASKGYGFIVPDNGWPDVLLHVTVLRRDGTTDLFRSRMFDFDALNAVIGTPQTLEEGRRYASFKPARKKGGAA